MRACSLKFPALLFESCADNLVSGCGQNCPDATGIAWTAGGPWGPSQRVLQKPSYSARMAPSQTRLLDLGQSLTWDYFAGPERRSDAFDEPPSSRQTHACRMRKNAKARTIQSCAKATSCYLPPYKLEDSLGASVATHRSSNLHSRFLSQRISRENHTRSSKCSSS